MNITRRKLIASALAVSAAAMAPTAEATPFFQKRRLPIGLQLWTLGDALARDMNKTFEAIAAIGYESVEFADYGGHSSPELRDALKRHGLRCESTHVSDEDLTQRRQASLDDARTLGVRYMVVPFLAIPERYRAQLKASKESRESIVSMVAEMSADDWKWQAERLNEHARAVKSAGMKFAYHNHNLEFLPVGDSTGFELLLRHTDPDLVDLELDLGWVAAAGLDPIAVLTANKGRVRLTHIKDVQVSTPANNALRLDPIELGHGRLDWKAILPVAFEVGVRHFYVEQEAPFTRPRIEAAKQNFDYLRKLI